MCLIEELTDEEYANLSKKAKLDLYSIYCLKCPACTILIPESNNKK